MKKMLVAGVMLVSIVVCTHTAGAQVQVETIRVAPGFPPDGPFQIPGQGRQMKTGTGRISGRLAAAESGAPVRRAQVRISGTDILAKSAVTDNDGRYEFRELPAGRFTITATKPGFVTMSYGQKRPFEAGKTIELGEGQVLEKANISMPRGSAISGRILDELGEPIADAQVTALRSAWVNGRRRLQPAGRPAQTNDLGQYRIYGLAPGDYYVSATLRGGTELVFSENIEVTATRATLINGVPLASSASDPRSGYAPTYFPGTANGAEAQKIQVAVGQEMPSADFGLLPVRLARVSGTVIGSDGRPVEGAMLQAVPRSASDSPLSLPFAGSARTDRNGQFTLNSVAPGDYTLQVRGIQMITSSAGGDTMMFTTRVGGGDGQAESGSVPLSVTGEDVTNVMVVTSKGVNVSGRVVFEGGKPSSAGAVRITAAATDVDGPMMMAGGLATVSAEGTFELRGLMGQRLIRPAGLPAGWYLKSVTLNGNDITDTGLNVKPGEPLSGLEVTFTSKSTEVTGGVTAGNELASDYSVVIFSEDAEKWTVPMTRHVAFARPNQQGRYQIRNLPPGSYHAIAVPYIAQGDWNDPEVLARLKVQATQVSLAEGEVKTLDLKLSGN